MNKLLSALIALSFMISATQATAGEERWPRWYVGLSGSMNWLSDSDIGGPVFRDNASFDIGWGLSGSIGYKPYIDVPVFDRMRFEIEAAYRTNDADRYTSGSRPGVGNIHSTAYMINGIYDVHTGTQWVPYFGAGAGWANVEYLGDKDMVFAYQLMTGIGYEPEAIPNTMFSLGYRFFSAQDANLTTSAGTPYDIGYDAHSMEAGIQMRF